MEIAAVEVEFSLFETAILDNGVARTCAELNIPIVAYSPLARGVLTDTITTPDDIPADSPIRRLYRFQGDNLEQNFHVLQQIRNLSKEYQPYTSANVAMSWVRAQSRRGGLPVIIPTSGTTRAENVRGNSAHVDFTEEDLERFDQILDTHKLVGDRGYPGQTKYLEG